MVILCEEIRVIGRVQGVFYRAFTQQTAQLLHITGWVQNTPEGDVIIHACGDEAILRQFHAKLRVGPPAATVNELRIRIIPQVKYEDFKVIR